MKNVANLEVDAVVIGGGPGGYTAAMRLAIGGKKTVLIEKDTVGGTCLNRGCIPTKALIHCAEALRTVKESAKYGILTDAVQVNVEKANEYKEEVVHKLANGVSYLLKKRQVEVIKGEASFVGSGEIKVIDAEGNRRTVSAATVVIATGSESAAPPIKGLQGKNVITSTEALNIKMLPKSMAVIGGGVVGMEIGSVYAEYGVDVTVLEALPGILPTLDYDVVNTLTEELERKMKIVTGVTVKEIRDVPGGNGIIYETQGETREAVAEKVLVCTGRRPNTKHLALEHIGVKIDQKGYIVVDNNYETNVPGIYAIGDVNGISLLAHAASAQALLVADHICGKNSGINTKLIPSCIYTRPEVACAGKTEDELKKERVPYNVGKFPLSANGRALSMGEPEGFVKILIDKKYGKILGAHIVGSRASELIGELVLAMNAECTVEEIVQTVHAHPTIPEAVFEAAEMALNGQTTHAL